MNNAKRLCHNPKKRKSVETNKRTRQQDVIDLLDSDNEEEKEVVVIDDDEDDRPKRPRVV